MARAASEVVWRGRPRLGRNLPDWRGSAPVEPPPSLVVGGSAGGRRVTGCRLLSWGEALAAQGTTAASDTRTPGSDQRGARAYPRLPAARERGASRGLRARARRTLSQTRVSLPTGEHGRSQEKSNCHLCSLASLPTTGRFESGSHADSVEEGRCRSYLLLLGYVGRVAQLHRVQAMAAAGWGGATHGRGGSSSTRGEGSMGHGRW